MRGTHFLSEVFPKNGPAYVCPHHGAGLLVTPLAALAQQPAKVYRIGFLSPNARESPTSTTVSDDFRNSLRDLGYVEGRNLVVDARWAEGKTERLPGLAAELAALKPDVIVALTTQATLAAKQAPRGHPSS